MVADEQLGTHRREDVLTRHADSLKAKCTVLSGQLNGGEEAKSMDDQYEDLHCDPLLLYCRRHLFARC